MPIVKTCCHCISLKSGTIASGVVGISLAIIGFILMIFDAVKVKTIVKDDLSPTVVKIILGLNLFITLLISILLIIGAVQRKRWFMLPWIILALIHAIGSAVSVIYTCVEYFSRDKATLGAITLVIGLPLVALYIYMWIVVFSYYQEVKEGIRGPYGRPIYS